jgi:hypothetical protein
MMPITINNSTKVIPSLFIFHPSIGQGLFCPSASGEAILGNFDTAFVHALTSAQYAFGGSYRLPVASKFTAGQPPEHISENGHLTHLRRAQSPVFNASDNLLL